MMPAQRAGTIAVKGDVTTRHLGSMPVRVLLLTSLVSILGNQLTGLAVPWFVLETTGSASKTGITAAVTVIPVIIATFFGGALVDRTGYRGLSVFSDLTSAVTLAAVPLFYLTTGLSFPGLLILMFLGAIFDAPGSTARQAMIPQLAQRSGVPLERINANFGMIAAASSLFAAPLAGLLIAWLGPVTVLWFNAGTFVFSGLAVFLLIPALERAEASGEAFMTDVKVGFRYVMSNGLIRTIIWAALVVNMLFAPLFGVAIPYFANQELQSVRALGIMLGGQGLGALVGSFLYGRLSGRFKRRTFLLAAMLLLTLPIFPLSALPNVWLATGLLAVIGLGSGLVNPMIETFIQTTTPVRLLGRVTGVGRAGAMIATPVGLVLGGSMIALLNLSGAILLIGLALVIVLVMLWINRSLYELDSESGSGTLA
jgi:MFS family permease